MLKQKFPVEKPLGSLVDTALLAFDVLTAEIHAASVRERPAKRLRKAPKRETKSPAATGELAQPDHPKRMRLQQPEEPMIAEETQNETFMKGLEEVLKRIEAILPRVGKKQIDSPAIVKDLNEMFPKYNIVKIIAGKGTDRKFEPPKEISPEEAPYRRSFMRLRENQKISIDPAWEKYDMLSKRQLIRKSPACRANITMFAARKFENYPGPCPPNVVQSQGDGNVPGMIENNLNMNPREEEPSRTSSEVPMQHESSPNVEPGTEIPKPETSKLSSSQNASDVSTERPNELLSGNSDQANNGPISVAERHGPRFRALPKEEQAMIKRAHQNLCHPSPEQLSAVMRAQGCRPEISQAVFDLKCSTCASCQKPKIARPGTLKDALDFNDKAFIDGISWTSKAGTMFHFYHLLDQATNYHVAIPAPSRSADQAIAKVSDAWFQWAGPPNTLIMDAATEFNSEAFDEFLQRHDVKGITTSPHAHWQNGRCERHGQILQSMLNKLDHEKPINTFKELQQALIQCTHAKNTQSIRAGYAPEVLVFGKSSKLPGSNISSEDISAHASANRDDGQGIAFRQSLELRERARVAFHRVDNDMALRRACLRRTRPDRPGYAVGEWVMMWQPQPNNTGHWFGPLKVIQQETNLSVWATMSGKLHRRAPEHVRPVCSAEARQIQAEDPSRETPQSSQSIPDISLPSTNPSGTSTNTNPIRNEPVEVPSDDNSSQSQDQPDTEPEGNNSDNGPITTDNPINPMSNLHIDTPVPESESDEQLVTSHLLCCEDEVLTVDPLEEPCAWRFELEVPNRCPATEWTNLTADEILLATTEKKQRTEVKLSLLTPEEKEAFQKAKETEVKNWLTTGTVSKILRSKLAPEQILRCRWLLVWKDKESDSKTKDSKGSSSKLDTHKAKARLVVLGYLDPNLTEVPRDSPTLGRQSKMLLLQLIASCGWSLGSFDIRAAFLQGRTQPGRTMGLEPVPELAEALKLKSNEVCKLEKSAYGLIDAPFLWFQTLCEELQSLGMKPSPFDPCLFILRHPESGELCGALGVHVDDGIYGGNEYFHQQIQKLEAKYPFGSKKSQSFTFTGIEMQQQPDQSIRLSQTKYVNNIPAITIKPERRQFEDESVTEEERHLLRGLVGSLQYAAVHTRPDLSSALSHLQSQINQAKVSTLITANKVLHSAKKHSDVCIQIQPIPMKDLRFVAFSDASFASKSKPESHAGMIILAAHKDISQNKSCPISPLSWGTKKIQRIVTSTLSAETTALSSALDQLTWLRLYWAWILDPKTEWQRPEKANNLPPAISIPTYKANDQDLAITDCKSLYDLTTRTAIPNCQEFRTQLLARSIKDVLSEGIRLHWVHSGPQLADALTKCMEANFLRETLRHGKYCLHDVDEVGLLGGIGLCCLLVFVQFTCGYKCGPPSTFKCPGMPLTPMVALASNVYLMCHLSHHAWVRLLVVSLMVFFLHSGAVCLGILDPKKDGAGNWTAGDTCARPSTRYNTRREPRMAWVVPVDPAEKAEIQGESSVHSFRLSKVEPKEVVLRSQLLQLDRSVQQLAAARFQLQQIGSAKCPCVGLAGLDGTTSVKLDVNTSVDYPGSFAAYCRAWDNDRNNVSCKEGQEPGKDKGWCAESWCYVDPCNCELDEPATKVPDDGRGMWYSYKTCGGKDYWMTPEKKKELQAVPKNCSKKVDEKNLWSNLKWGDEKCRCIGYDGAPGSANEVPYPAETGASCSAWDEKNHPDCQGAKPAAWCKQAWCYVDPCECSLVVPPKTSSYLPKGVGNGKPIYFSYAACGADDEYTAGNEEACVNQVETNCTKLDKCAWDGKQCLGKDGCGSNKEDDEVLSRMDEKESVLEFLADFHDRRPKHRARITQLCVRLLEFETWREALASSNPSVAATLHALTGLSAPVRASTAVNLETAAELAASRGCIGALYLRIVSAKALPKDGLAPFVRARLGGNAAAAAPQRTETAAGAAPRWEATPFVFEVPNPDASITMEVLSSDETGDDLLGSAGFKVLEKAPDEKMPKLISCPLSAGGVLDFEILFRAAKSTSGGYAPRGTKSVVAGLTAALWDLENATVEDGWIVSSAKNGAKITGLACPAGHPIDKRKEGMSWRQSFLQGETKLCNLCNSEIHRHETRWRCFHHCDFNVCEKCYREKAAG
eukprot:s557_g8.t1